MGHSHKWSHLEGFHVIFAKPIDQELVLDIDLLTLNPRAPGHLELLYPLTRDGLLKAALAEYHTQKQAMSRFSLAALLLSDPMLKILRRELRKLSPSVGVEVGDIKEVLMQEILKREVVEGEKAEEARKRIQKLLRRQMRSSQAKGGSTIAEEPEEEDRGNAVGDRAWQEDAVTATTTTPQSSTS